MNLSKILAELKAERRKLDAAIRALQALAGSSHPTVYRARRVSNKGKVPAVRARLSTGVTTVTGNLLMFPRRGRQPRRSAAEKSMSGGGREA